MPSLPTKNRRYHLGERIDLLEWHGGHRASARGRLRRGWQCAVVARAWCQEPGGRRDPPGECHAGARSLRSCGGEPIENALQSLSGPFDLIICADVLEHLVDPWDVVNVSVKWQRSDGEILVSMPNIRYLRALARIAVGAGFRPEAEGIFDATHLHFFTKDNIAQLLVSGGWEPCAGDTRHTGHDRQTPSRQRSHGRARSSLVPRGA